MTKLVNLFAVAAILLLGALPAGAAELLTKPGKVVKSTTVRYSHSYPFMGWRPSFEYTAGYRGYHAEPYFIGPVPACGVVKVPVWRRGEWEIRHGYRCW